MYGALDTSVSGMVAQRVRMNTIAANLANRSTVADAQGNAAPYQRRIPIFEVGDPSAQSAEGRSSGVHVSEILLDEAPPRMVLEPNSPYADADGYVAYPNIDPMTEQVSIMEAARAYEANVAAAEATKSLVAQLVRLLG
ncbi:MAG: flagellar basal body rod protein FlgC [Planctomycetota bacterium]